ncbi:MAG: HEAT repeat domain-containing protein [Anaerolineae bacterium]|nr:HEAT repeat domain-containing protein [Anaerolineae bacterium]
MFDTQPNAFEEKIDRMITQLGDKNTARRREAAEFLGEVAAADAVHDLVEVYRKDKSAQVRAAAAYSLGMYKAVERALKAGDEAKVVDLLTGIEKEGKIGKRAPIGRAIRINIALVVVLIVLIVVYFYSPDIEGRLFGSTRPRSEVVASVLETFTLVKNDTRSLQTELLDVISTRPLSCTAFFNNAPIYRLDPVDVRAFPDIASLVTQINSAQNSLASAKAPYDAACNDGAAFGAAEAQSAFQRLLPALQALDPLEVALIQAAAAAPTAIPPMTAPTNAAQPTTAGATSAPQAASPAPNATTAPAAQPTAVPATPVGANPKAHLSELFGIIQDVTGTFGAGTLLVQYWTEVQNFGQTNGCAVRPPTVPSYDIFIPEADFQASPDLRDAVQLITSGLAALRTGWTNFQFDCNARSLVSVAETRLQDARVALDAFTTADLMLQGIQASP